MTPPTSFDVAIIGGGIVGLATALAVTDERPGARIIVVEKETRWAAHQSGRNSGVIHAGVSYRPGSLKATMCKLGNVSMMAFCARHAIPYERCGKLIVAADRRELPALDALAERGRANGVARAGSGRRRSPTSSPTSKASAPCMCPTPAWWTTGG